MIINQRQAEALVEVLENEADDPEGFITVMQGSLGGIKFEEDDVFVATNISNRIITRTGEIREVISDVPR